MRYRRLARGKSIFFAAAMGLLLPLLTAAQAETSQLTAIGASQLTAIEVFDPLNLFGSGSVGVPLSPGTVTCPGAQPTGNPMQPCPPGSRINMRGTQVKSRYISQSPLLNGWVYLEGNCNFDANATGHVWGTFRIELDAGGVWIGSWSVHRSKAENMKVWVGRGSFVGRGTGGNVDGMHLLMTEVLISFMPFGAYVGSIDALILAPPPSR